MALRLPQAPRSLRTRLVAITVMASTGAVVLLIFGVQLLLSRATNAETARLLHTRADAAASTVRLMHGRPTVLGGTAASLNQGIWTFGADGRRIGGGVPPPALRTTIRHLADEGTESTLVVDGIKLYARPVVSSGGQRIADVVTSLDLAPYETSERRGLLASITLGVLTVLTAGAAAWASVSASLRLVRRMAHRADEWREHDLHGRFDLGEPVDELTELGQTLDHMLNRIASALQSERRLTDEIAHELRTPLSVIRSEAQLALMEGPVATLDPADGRVGSRSSEKIKESALRAIIVSTEQMDNALETMLQVARNAHHDEDAQCSATEAVATVRDRAVRLPGVSIVTDEDGVELHVAAPQAVVVAALGPLIDNAIRHARSCVRLSVRAHRSRVLIQVRDDGPGVPPEQRELIFQPGHSSGGHGAGLGLALARRLAHSMGAEVRVSGEGHGLFVLDLPAA